MGNITAPQGTVLVTFEMETAGIRSSQGAVMAVYGVPSQSMRSSQALVSVTFNQTAKIRVAQAHVLALVRGSINNPRLRAWTFDLDGHEFYVLRLGNNKTLLYDLTTQQWSWWSTGSLGTWRTNVGVNWLQSGSVAQNYGSNVVVGDDNYGILWVLNPEQGYDDSATDTDRENSIVKPFPRVATGQITVRGRMTIPCYQVYLTADNGQPAYTGASVSLSYSDDNGKTYVDASEPITVEAGNYYQEYVWRSIGLARAPGRIFRITDDGAFAKIDELTIYDNSTS